MVATNPDITWLPALCLKQRRSYIVISSCNNSSSFVQYPHVVDQSIIAVIGYKSPGSPDRSNWRDVQSPKQSWRDMTLESLLLCCHKTDDKTFPQESRTNEMKWNFVLLRCWVLPPFYFLQENNVIMGNFFSYALHRIFNQNKSIWDVQSWGSRASFRFCSRFFMEFCETASIWPSHHHLFHTTVLSSTLPITSSSSFYCSTLTVSFVFCF